MSNLKGLASIAKGLSAAPSAELVNELAPQSDDPLTINSKTRADTKPLAKTRDENYKRVMVLIRKSTEKAAYRKWEDTHPEKDFSDLVEDLLSSYVNGHISA